MMLGVRPFLLSLAFGWLWAHSESATTRAPVAAFNGKDLSGFYTWLVDSQREDSRDVFSVADGQIRISGDGLGYLATEAVYENYRLIVEYKWGEKNWHWGNRIGRARDSGLFLHATGPDGNSVDGNGAWMMAIECNVFQGAVGDFLLIRGKDSDGVVFGPTVTVEASERRDEHGFPWWQPGGNPRTLQTWGRVNWLKKSPEWRDELDFKGSEDVERSGQWNQIECICDGDRITVKVNGVMVNQASAIEPSRGKILLQCEGSEIFFRKFEIYSIE